jgi:YggT family protein
VLARWFIAEGSSKDTPTHFSSKGSCMQYVWITLDYLLMITQYVIAAHAILSWLIAFNVINTYNDFVGQVWNALEKITRPIYAPIRRILPDFGALDLSPLVVLLLIVLLRRLISLQTDAGFSFG